MEQRALNAEKTSSKWLEKYKKMKKEMKECRDVVVLYEGLMNKLTEQNDKLKAINRSRKSSKSRIDSFREAKKLVQKQPDKSIFDNITTLEDHVSAGAKSARSDCRGTHTKKDSKFGQSPVLSARGKPIQRPKSSLLTHRVEKADITFAPQPAPRLSQGHHLSKSQV